VTRPTVVCPRCGSVETVAVAINGRVVVRRCWCGQEFDVDTSRPGPVRELVQVAS